MAGDFLRSNGVDIDAEMARIQGESIPVPETSDHSIGAEIYNVRLPGNPVDKRWRLGIRAGAVDYVREDDTSPGGDVHPGSKSTDGRGGLLAPSLCHPHIHLDKAFLLSHPKYSNLQISQGTFKEAMALTGRAKAKFSLDDLLERGQRVIDESVRAGVSHMRAFVEVDAGVHDKCLEAGVILKQRAEDDSGCHVQLCAFAQLPLFSPADGDETGEVIRRLMRESASRTEVAAIGSTPYVEWDRERAQKNIDWVLDLSIEFKTHLDFHLDYNLDPTAEALVWYVVDALERKAWAQHVQDRTIVLGHCTRLALFDPSEWQDLAARIRESNLPISFVGLPTSDLYMMRTNSRPDVRGTLDIPKIIREYGLNACLGINNIGNAFTPQGTCDPLSLACQGVGIYQAGTQQDVELLFEAVSVRAKSAIGFRSTGGLNQIIRPGISADFILFSGKSEPRKNWQTIKGVSDAVYLYDHCLERTAFFKGKINRTGYPSVA